MMDHVRPSRQQVELAAGQFSVQALRLAIVHHRIGISGENGRRRKQRAITRAVVLRGGDHVGRILGESLYLGRPQSQWQRKLRGKAWRNALRREHLLDQPRRDYLAREGRYRITEEVPEQRDRRRRE